MQAGFLTAERGSEDEVIVVICKVPVGGRDRDADNGEGIAMSWSSRRGASAATGRRSPLRAWRPMPGPVLQSPEAIAAALRAMSAELAADGDHPERRDMGTTVVGLSLSPERVIWFNVGDVAAEADDSLGP